MRDKSQDVRDERMEHNRPKGRNKGKGKSKGKVDKLMSRNPKDMTEACNDLSWYSSYPELVNASASFPYSWPLGNTIKEFDDNAYNYRLPGMMAISVILTPGIATSANSPITLAGRNLYSWIRHDNSGAKNYEAPDLIMYFLAMDNCYAMYAYLCRALVYMTTINPENRYYPRHIISAMGFNYEDLHGNLAQFEYVIEQLRVKLQKLSMPAHLPLFERHRWLFSSVYTDTSTSKAQTYFFKPYGFHKWVEGVDQTLGELQFVDLDSFMTNQDVGLTLSDITNMINVMVEPILGSEDFNIIAGDIRKSFQGDVYTVEPMSAFIIPPTYDPEVLSQIENMSTHAPVTATLNITQNRSLNAGYIQFDPEFVVGAAGSKKRLACTRNRLVSLDLNDPKAGDTMIATRLTNIPDLPGTSETRMKCSCIGSEIVAKTQLYCMGSDANTLSVVSFNVDSKESNSPGGTLNFTMETLSRLSKFAKHPSLVIYSNKSDSGTPTAGEDPQHWMVDMREVDKYTVLSPKDLHNMHDTAVMSLLSWPQIR